MTFNVGDMVWYRVSEKKERMGEITSLNSQYAIVLGADRVHQCELCDIRLATPADVPIVEENTEGGTKHDSSKNRLELIPASALEAMGRAFTYGSIKYADHNWAKGFDWDRLVGAMMRHLNSWRAGEDKDPESGLSHLDHVLACAAMLAAHEQEGLGYDNRRKRNK